MYAVKVGIKFEEGEKIESGKNYSSRLGVFITERAPYKDYGVP
jgi:hypothetical protein